MENKFEKETLLKLYRKYSKEELFSFLIRICKTRGKRIKELEKEIQQLKSEDNKVLSKNKQKEYNSLLEANKNLLIENRKLKR